MSKPPKAVSEWLASIGAKGGAKGGKACGQRKTRSPEHYARMVAARKAKKKAADEATVTL
jgi:hypothetical protein